MKKSLIGFILLSLAAFGCSSGNVVSPGSQINQKSVWVQSMGSYEQGLGAVGSAPTSPLGSSMQIDEASVIARRNLAANIGTRVRSALERTAKQLSEGTESGTKVTASNFVKVVDQNLIDQTLNGSRVIKQWVDPENGELWVWMVIDFQDISKTISSKLQQTLASANSGHEQDMADLEAKLTANLKNK